MNQNSYQHKISSTIEKLSDPKTYGQVCHEQRLGEPMPSTKKLSTIVELVREIIFPGYFGNTSLRPNTIQHYMGVYVDELYQLLSDEILAGLCFECTDQSENKMIRHTEMAKQMALDFIDYLPEIRRKLVNDVNSIFLGDPAAVSFGEVIFCYPAIKAITNYRVAHRLYELKVPLIPRYISEMAHSETGIDIHPCAQIGEYFTIDHGTGVVIGSTCIIGHNVKIFQGVTLGAKSFELDENGNPVKGIPRHPIVEDNVIIYAGATILGRITIGKNSIIGGNVWVTRDLPPNSKVAQSRHREHNFLDGAGI
jgi:serine O-acetyltransferase